MTGKLPLDEEASGLHLARAIARRVDKLEPGLADAHRKLGKLTQGMAILLQAQENEQESEGQPDWLTCRDAAEARTILTETMDWVEECGRYLGVAPVECWPWHPPAVAVLLSGARHYRSAYAGESTVTVVDLLTRYLPAIHKQVPMAMREDTSRAPCNGAIHREGEAPYSYDLERLDALAFWWATDRTGLPPGLRPRATAA
jgi:hypothetical protein